MLVKKNTNNKKLLREGKTRRYFAEPSKRVEFAIAICSRPPQSIGPAGAILRNALIGGSIFLSVLIGGAVIDGAPLIGISGRIHPTSPASELTLEWMPFAQLSTWYLRVLPRSEGGAICQKRIYRTTARNSNPLERKIDDFSNECPLCDEDGTIIYNASRRAAWAQATW